MRTDATLQLLEREGELAELERLVDAVAAGSGGLVWLEGPAGIGKSCLLDVGLQGAAERGVTVLDARGGELEREFPFGVVRQLFEPRLAAATEEERGELLGGPAGLAAPLVDAPAGGSLLADASFPVLHGIFWLAANLAQRAPLVLVVDDAHWADPPSLRALAYLARRVQGTPILVVAAARSGEPAADPDALDAIAGAADVVLRPQSFSEEGASAFALERMGDQVTPAFASACLGATGGNPFLLHELLGELSASGAAGDERGAAMVRELSPKAVRRAALARLARLGEDAVVLARAVAVLGTRAELRDAATLGGIGEADAAAAADVLAGADLLRAERPLDFVHPLVRRCVYDDMPPSRRATMHAAAARLLSERGRESAPAHLLATDAAADPWVVEQLEAAAARAVQQGAPDAAIRFLERALTEPPDPDARGRIVGALGAAEARVPARRGAALEHLREAGALATNPFERLLHSVELGQALLMAGRVDESVTVLERELAALPDDQAEIGHVLQGALLVASYASPQARRMVAARPWRFTGDDDRAPQTAGDRVWLAVRAFETSITGDDAARSRALALRALDDGRLLAEQTADSPVFYLAANTLLNVDALDEALAAFDAAVAEAQRRGSLRGWCMASCWRAETHVWSGNPAAAIADAQATLERVVEADLALGVPQVSAFLVRALTEVGDLEAAEQALAAGHGAGDAAGDQVGLDMLLHAAGRLRLAQGRPEQALEQVVACGRRQEAWGIRAPLLPWRSDAARALRALGRGEEARSLAEEDVALSRTWGAARALGIALRGAAAAAGDDGRAVELLREACATLERSSARLEHAHALVELGAALRRTGERAAARDPLREGLSAARACGAHALTARAYDELEATGVHQRRIVRGGADALTPSERRIAELAAGGMSNRDIAASLFVTVRTVEAHLGHAYRKLGIAGRAGLAEALGAAG